MKISIIPLFIFFIFMGCSSIDKESKHLNVLLDSEKRGLEVFDENKQLIGKTPFYYKFKNQEDQKLFYKEGDSLTSLEISCERLGNFLFGYFYACPEYFRIENPNQDLDFKPQVLFVKPRPKWKIPDDIRKEIEKRYVIVSDSELDKRLNLFDGHPKSIEEFKETPQTILRSVNHSNIDFILFFFKEKDDEIAPIIIEIRNFLAIDTFKGKGEKFKAGTLEKALEYFDFFPNALTLNYFFQGRVEGKKDGVKYKSDKRDVARQSDFIPNFLPVIGIENILYPQKYDPGTLKFFFAPSFNSYSFKYSDNLDNELYIMEGLGLGAYYNAQLVYLYNPMAITFGAGLGLVYEDINDIQGFSNTGFDFRSRLFGSLTGFIGDRWFSQLGFVTYSLSSDLRDRGPYAPEGFSEFYLALGYYFPELRFL